MKKRYLYSAIILMATSILTGGCGSSFLSEEKQVTREHIELTTPVVFESTAETAAKRNIYNAVLGTYTVTPLTEEYAFTEDVKSIEYRVLPGSEVKAGDILAVSDNHIEKEIENIESELEKQATEIESLKEAYLSSGDAKVKKELDMKQELFELDYAYKTKKADLLKAELEKNILKTDISGLVSAIANSTNSTKKGTAVVAVSDMSQKLIYTDFFKAADLRASEEFYVLSKGKRYSCENLACEEKNKSLFRIIDPGNDINVGDTCVFVLMKNHVENAISISTELIKNDSSGSYVYVQNDANQEKRYLTTGISDGYFTEIIAGLSDGEKIAESEAENDTGKRGTVAKANTTSEGNDRGYFFWPKSENITCNIKNGAVYITKYVVDLFDSVEKGDVICEIYVVGDDVELERLQLQLQRAKERNASEESINELSTKVEALLDCYNAKTITADKAGIVVGITEHKPGDTIKYGETLVQITDAQNCYVTVRNLTGLYLGNEVTITYTNTDRKQSEAKGRVINLGKNANATTLKADYQLIQISDEDAQQIMKAQRSGMGRAGISVSFSSSQYTNVLAVPKGAVTVYSGNYSVNIVAEDGTIRKQCFLCLGSDKNYYYCLEGLKEGETVCLK